MYSRKFILISFLCFAALQLAAQKKVSIPSPDKKIKFEFTISSGRPEYAVGYKGQYLAAHSALGLTFQDDGDFGTDVRQGKAGISKGVEEYDLPMGKTSHVSAPYTQAIIPLKEKDGKQGLINLQVRVFNDGLGFRYTFPEQPDKAAYTLTEERSNFNLSGNPTVRVAFLENYFTSHEHRYHVMSLKQIPNDTLMDMPVLFEYPGKIYVAITEANLVNYAGMSLIKKNGMLTTQLTPLPGQNEIKVKAKLPHQTPWRVMMIGDRIGTLIESNILTSLSDPSKVPDVSWLKPGKATFHWWNGDISPDTIWEPGLNFDFEKILYRFLRP